MIARGYVAPIFLVFFDIASKSGWQSKQKSTVDVFITALIVLCKQQIAQQLISLKGRPSSNTAAPFPISHVRTGMTSLNNVHH